MKLLPKSIKIPTLDETAELGISEQFVYAKLFNPYGIGTWYITSYDPETKEAFGFVNLNDPQMAELGYISIEELENLKLPFRGKIERDIHFSKMKLQDVIDKVKNNIHV